MGDTDMLKTIAVMSASLLICATLAQAAGSTSAATTVQTAASSAAKTTPGAAMNAVPPSRPIPLTHSQVEALKSAQAEAEHSRVLEVTATYSAREERLKWTRFSDDVWTVIYQVGWPGAFLAVALCAI
jgi:hypothetical protein